MSEEILAATVRRGTLGGYRLSASRLISSRIIRAQPEIDSRVRPRTAVRWTCRRRFVAVDCNEPISEPSKIEDLSVVRALQVVVRFRPQRTFAV
jgi:hypothetical protein